MRYTNGNATIEINTSNGTRIITFEDELQLEYPLNIDIRVSEKCSMGMNPKTGLAKCAFCHESARVDGQICDFNKLLKKLAGLPAGIELAIGANQWTPEFIKFLEQVKGNDWIANVTVNQGHLKRDYAIINSCIANGLIKGLGVSYRPDYDLTDFNLIENQSNLVVHVIAGIDDFANVEYLSHIGIEKILVLGEKNFGFNIDKVNLQSPSHIKWYREVIFLTDQFRFVSFDNLALEQLNFKRFVKPEHWKIAYQGEHSMYINAVSGYYSPSSRDSNKVDWDEINLVEFFKNKE